MTGNDLVALLPMLIPALAAVAVLLQVAVRRSASAALGITLLGLAGGLATLPAASSAGPRHVTALLAVDDYTLWYWGLLLAATLAIVPMVYAYLSDSYEHPEEALVLVLVTALGACILAAAIHFITVFLGIELLSVSLFALVGYLRKEEHGIEAGAKYLVLAAASSGFFLFGLALIYGATGEMSLTGLARAGQAAAASGLVQAGVALVLVGIGFKLGVVPFHLWAPDVYQGAPAPVTALVATVSKGGIIAVLARWVLDTDLEHDPTFLLAIAIIAGASMLLGNLLALTQNNVKRLLAYSSIAHFGYVLVALVAGGKFAAGAVAFYVTAYIVTSVGSFGTISLLSHRGYEAEDLAGYRGMFWRHPGTAAMFTAMLLSLAGVPLTAGFLGKLFVLRTGVGAAQWTLVLLLAVGSVLGVFYYLRVVATMFQASDDEAIASPSPSAAGWLPVVFATAFLFLLGIFPTPFMGLLARAAAVLS